MTPILFPQLVISLIMSLLPVGKDAPGAQSANSSRGLTELSRYRHIKSNVVPERNEGAKAGPRPISATVTKIMTSVGQEGHSRVLPGDTENVSWGDGPGDMLHISTFHRWLSLLLLANFHSLKTLFHRYQMINQYKIKTRVFLYRCHLFNAFCH